MDGGETNMDVENPCFPLENDLQMVGKPTSNC